MSLWGQLCVKEAQQQQLQKHESRAYLAARDQQLLEVAASVISDVLLQVTVKVCNTH